MQGDLKHLATEETAYNKSMMQATSIVNVLLHNSGNGANNCTIVVVCKPLQCKKPNMDLFKTWKTLVMQVEIYDNKISHKYYTYLTDINTNTPLSNYFMFSRCF